jgi:hypothetical protein
MLSLIFSLWLLNSSISGDSLLISTNNNHLNFDKDSLLSLDVVYKNTNKQKFRIRRLTSTHNGEICTTQEWTILIYHKEFNDSVDSLYSPPGALCHLRDEPYIFLRKDEEYHYKLLLNFKYFQKGDRGTYITNHSFGEYQLQLVLTMKDNRTMKNLDSIGSNKIKIFYTRDK